MKQLVIAAIAAATLAVGAGTAFAGEVTGNGDQTPVKTRGVAASICAFSGLEDKPFGPGTVQTAAEAEPGVVGFACSPGRP